MRINCVKYHIFSLMNRRRPYNVQRTNLQYRKTILEKKQLKFGGKIGILFQQKQTKRNFLLPTVALQTLFFSFLLQLKYLAKTNFSLKICLRRIFTSLRNYKNKTNSFITRRDFEQQPYNIKERCVFLVEKQLVHSRFTLHITVTEWKPNYLSFLRESNTHTHIYTETLTFDLP